MRGLVTLLSLPAFVYAYSLSELVDIAHQNKVIESATHQVNASQKSYESTKRSYLPTVEIGANLQNVYEETPALPENSMKAYASLKYTLYDGGKRGDLYNQLSANVDASRKSLEAIKNDIALDVSRLYFEYLALLSDKQATLQEIEQLKAEYSRLDMFYKTGSVTQDEVQKIDSRLKSADVALHEIELGIQKVLHTLEYYTTKEIETITEGSHVKHEENSEIKVRPDIQALEYQAEATRFEAESKQSATLPTLYFDNTASYSEYYFDQEPVTRFLVDKQNIATLNLSWKIFDFGATNKSYEAKYEEYLSKKTSLEYQKAVADVDYRLAQKSLEIASIKIDATKATLEAASSTYDLIKLRYQNGMIDNVAYLQALSEKYEAARGYKRALYDYEVKKAEVIYYSGKNRS
ncbi:MAG: TolC family protein, partial [Sulfurimonas sp.]|nr:TolC family protein [Sulfurimonas sp.]